VLESLRDRAAQLHDTLVEPREKASQDEGAHGSPAWIQDIAGFNPVDWAVRAGRQAVSSDVDWGLVLSHGGYLLAFALLSA
jgi:hypothetical protein